MKAVHPSRSRLLLDGRSGKGPVVYWMSRNQRAEDNWALLFALERAARLGRRLITLFILLPRFRNARKAHFDFMLWGLRKTAEKLIGSGIPFFLLGGRDKGEDGSVQTGILTEAVRKIHAAELVIDFDPLRGKRAVLDALATAGSEICPLYEVDARNVVPAWTASTKQEYAARTIRPKILNLLPEYTEDFPDLRRSVDEAGVARIYTGYENEATALQPYILSWEEAGDIIAGLPSGPDLSWIDPGEEAARTALRLFIETRLKNYGNDRNNPNLHATSNLSPYLHFGQISAQRIALEVNHAAEKRRGFWEAVDVFLEELIIRRELADNYCYYNPEYDSVTGFPDWARKTLEKHRADPRPYTYSREELEFGKTHDDLWNAAQRRLVEKGTMHGYLRMYWAKKILEWTESPEQAMEIAVYLNDSYQLDGRDPNGYAGIAWAVGGVHDRPWKERDIFGTVRYMNYNGCKRKFDVARYVETGGGP